MEREEWVRRVGEMAGSVWDFHERFGVENIQRESTAGKEELEVIQRALRNLPMVTEEVGELARAINKKEAEQIASESADIVYAGLSNCLSLGDYGQWGMNFVNTKNNAKSPKDHAYTGKGKITRKEGSWLCSCGYWQTLDLCAKCGKVRPNGKE